VTAMDGLDRRPAGPSSRPRACPSPNGIGAMGSLKSGESIS
jgi:hypothetical protein